MLFIGDIHITSKYKDKILTSLRNFINSQPEEKHLIFLGDFVYHFSYDRGALLSLYDFFLELYSQEKHLYILAGNHDRLTQSFVFEEAKKAFQLLQVFGDATNASIQFITEPQIIKIEGKEICFLPYLLEVDLAKYPGIEQLQDDFYQKQIASKNKNQMLSAKLHLLVQYFKNHYSNLTFVHHYYFDSVVFPGQKSTFSFRDVALSNQWLEDKELFFISGHLHQAFFYQNYLCTGSIWASSPLEENQIKGYWKLSENQWSFYESGINYYFLIDSGQLSSQSLFGGETLALTPGDIETHHKKLQENFKQNVFGLELSGSDVFHSPGQLEVDFHFLSELDLKRVSLSLRVEELNYQKMESFVTVQLQAELQDVKLKKQQVNVDDLLEKLQKPDASSLKEGFGGRIDLLKRFLMKQYPDTYQEYEKILQDMKLI